MTTDCSLNYKFNTWKFQAQTWRACCVQKLFLTLQHVLPMFCKKKSFWQRFTCTGQRVWCTKKSGGIQRSWVGVPRKLFFPGRTERCACVKDTGASLFEPNSNDPTYDDGDLHNPNLKLYQSCANDPHATSCIVSDIDLKWTELWEVIVQCDWCFDNFVLYK